MTRIFAKRLAFGVTAVLMVGVASQLASAQAPSPDVRGVRIAALGAKEVSEGAITHRSGKSRRIVPATPSAQARPQAGDAHEWCPTCTWEQENKGWY